MSVLLGFNFSTLSSYLLLTIVLLCAFLTFGQPLYFDRLMVFASILGMLITYRIDKNIFSILTIVACSGGASELLWLYRDNLGVTSSYVLPLLIPVVSYLTRECFSSKIGFLISFLVILAHIYWAVSGNPIPVGMSWFMTILAINQLVILALLYRPHFLTTIFPDADCQWLTADGHLMSIATWIIFLESLVVFEYLLRHTLMLKDFLYVYNIYEYLAQTLHVIMLFIILNETWGSIRKNIFRA